MGKKRRLTRRPTRSPIKMPAYFTLEATMVLTLVTGIIVWLLYLMFYQYDRCLADQDTGALALKGCSIQAATKEEILQNVETYALQLDEERYIAWEQGNTNITLKENKIKVEQTGKLVFPFQSIVPGNIRETWEMRSAYENRRILPVSFLRNVRKMTGGK